MSGENCLIFRISLFSWVDLHSNILNCGKSVRNLGMGLLRVITRTIGQMMYEARFTKVHSHKKEMQLSNFLKGWIFVTILVLKLLSIANEPWTIFEWGFFHIVKRLMLFYHLWTLGKEHSDFLYTVLYCTESVFSDFSTMYEKDTSPILISLFFQCWLTKMGRLSGTLQH